ncbi:MAG: dihydrofolate reductase family protein [Cyclobacteriaceae bacterium]
MRKIILSLAISLDGFIEGPRGEYDWCFTDQDYGMTDFYQRIDSVFMGRKSYELTLSMGDVEMPGVPKFQDYVFSNTLTEVKPGAILISGDIGTKVERIKNEKGKDIWLFGGAELTTSLLNLGLVDELSLAIHPVVLGGGKPLFIDIQNRVELKLINSKTYSSGLVAVAYEIK